MKKLHHISPLHLLVFLSVFVTSCSGQNQSNAISQTNTFSSSLEQYQLNFAPQCKKWYDINPSALKNENQIAQYVKDLHQDKYGNYWFATESKGVALQMSDAIIYMGKKDGIADNQVNGITQDKNGKLWFATANGVSSYTGAEFVNYSTKDGLLSNTISAILADSRGFIWAATEKGVCKFDGKRFLPFEIPKPEVKDPTIIVSLDHVWKIIEDRKGNIWFARDGYGATKFDGKSFTHYTKKEGLCGNDVASISEDIHGNMWFGTIATRVPTKENKFHYVDSKDGGLTLFDGNTFTQFPEVEGLKGNDIYPIYSDKKGDVWIGAKHYGVYKYDGVKMKLYKEADGLTNNCLQSVLEDKEGKLWFGFSGGLFKMEGDKIKNEPLSNYVYYDEPYRIKLRVEKGKEQGDLREYTLSVEIILDYGVYFVSPKSKENYSGFFDVSIKDNDHLKMGTDISENPASKEMLDPYSNELVNTVNENTSYKMKLTILSKGDFTVEGLVKFVIEPRCTLEEMPFLITHESGELKIKKLIFDGC